MLKNIKENPAGTDVPHLDGPHPLRAALRAGGGGGGAEQHPPAHQAHPVQLLVGVDRPGAADQARLFFPLIFFNFCFLRNLNEIEIILNYIIILNEIKIIFNFLNGFYIIFRY
jgi:hypothetical protein